MRSIFALFPTEDTEHTRPTVVSLHEAHLQLSEKQEVRGDLKDLVSKQSVFTEAKLTVKERLQIYKGAQFLKLFI